MILILRSLPRLIKNASQDMRRHFSMTLSAILSIAIALLLSMSMAIITMNVDEMTDHLESQMELQVSLNPTLEFEQIQTIGNILRQSAGVANVEYSNKDQELDKLIAENGEMFEQYRQSNPLYNVFIVEVNPIEDIDAVAESLSSIDGVMEVSYGGDSIPRLIRAVESFRTIGYLVTAGLLLLGVFLISNTIRMTILVRSDEIGIMRTVGAYNFYILTPFVLEGLAMGFWGGLIPSILVAIGYSTMYYSMDGMLVSEMMQLIPPFPFLFWVMGAGLVIGLLLGSIGAWFATHRYIRRAR